MNPEPVSRNIIFTDIRGFTKMCEEATIALRSNSFLSQFYSIIERKFVGGQIKYLGDGAMIITEFDIDVILHNIYKVRKQFEAIWNNFRKDVGVEGNLHLGFGIARGPLLEIMRDIQNFITLKDYISPRINLASRLCSLARPEGIIIHHRSFNELPEDYRGNFQMSVLKNIPGIERQQDLRCWVEHKVELREQKQTLVLNLDVEVHIAGVAIRNSKVLLCKRTANREIAASKWSLPGGKFNGAVSFEKALQEIFKKDVGLEIVHEYPLATYFIDEHRIAGLIFGCEIKEGNHTNEDDQNEKVRMFTLDEIYQIPVDARGFEISDIERALVHSQLPEKPEMRVRIAISPLCNYKCFFCHHDNIDSSQASDTAKIIKSIENISREFDLHKFTITGGEPFFGSNFKSTQEITKTIYQLNPKANISIVTNGVLIKDDELHWLKKNRIRVKLSVYSFSNDTDGLGITEDEYYFKLLKLMKLFAKKNITFVINVPLLKNTVSDFEKFLVDLNTEKIRPDSIKLVQLVNWGRGSEEFRNNAPSIEELPFLKGKEDFVNSEVSKFTHLRTLSYKQQSIEIFKYPCLDNSNCSICFGSWDLVINQIGELQVCTRSINGMKGKSILDKLCNISVKFVDYASIYKVDN